MKLGRRNILVAAFAVIFVTVIAWVLGPATPSTQFSALAWQQTPAAKREPMANDFIARHFRKGMSRAEVVALLGNPDPGNASELWYKVGEVMIDDRMLSITLDEDGNASSATIIHLS